MSVFAPHEPPSIKLGKSTLDEVSSLAIGGTAIAAVVDGGVQLVSWPKLRRMGKPKVGVVDVAFSNDGQQLAMASGDAAKVAMGVARTFAGAGPVHSVAFSPDGARLAVGGYQRVRIYDIAAGRELVAWNACERAAMRIAWSPDGAHVATRSWDEVGWFDAATGSRLAAIAVASEDADLAFLPDGRLISAIDDTAVGAWTLAAPATPQRIEMDGLVRSLAVSPSVVALEDRQLRVQLLTPALEPLELLEGCINQIHSLAISQDGRIVLAGDGNRLAAWRRNDG